MDWGWELLPNDIQEHLGEHGSGATTSIALAPSSSLGSGHDTAKEPPDQVSRVVSGTPDRPGLYKQVQANKGDIGRIFYWEADDDDPGWDCDA